MGFQVGERVLLKVSPLERDDTLGKAWEIGPEIHHTLEVLDRIGPMAYQLQLPPGFSSVHPVIHASNLRKCLPGKTLATPLDDIEVNEYHHFVEQPIEVMDRETKRARSNSSSEGPLEHQTKT